MAGNVLQIDNFIVVDQMAVQIATRYSEWATLRNPKLQEWQELRNYIYATDTRHTSNAKLPWSNSTTIPKLTQIRDNLFANYIATMFPKRRWLNWEGESAGDEEMSKVRVIKDYMMWAISQRDFKESVKKLVADYIDYGNTFATVEWVDGTYPEGAGVREGYTGPRIVRLDPQNFIMNPVAESFAKTPKMWRSLVSLGEAKEVLERMSTTPEVREQAQAVFDHAMNYRASLATYTDASLVEFDRQFSVDGFGSYKQYLESDYVELITFAGDIYDREKNELKKNRLIVVMDRAKLAIDVPYPYPMAEVPIFHSGWRIRQDNLWAMGPLDNLVGMQYRLDHIENMKSDIIDLTAYPVLKIKGSGEVSEFEWAPMERIYVDQDGDVDVVQPQVNALQYNQELAILEAKMEEMAGSPKEAMGFRTPGEKTAYEVQRLENAASRIFQSKIAQFEEQILEPLLNAMLVLAKENLTASTLRVVDDQYGAVTFETITREDISANGRLRPIAARHFAEQAELIQNLTNWSNSPLGADPEIKIHFSKVKLAGIINEALNLEEYEAFQPYVGITEAAEAEKLSMSAQEDLAATTMAPSGLTPDDYSESPVQELEAMMGGMSE